MFRRPKVPNDNKKHLSFSFVSLLIPVFIDFPHVLFAQEVFGEIKDFWNSEMGDLVRGCLSTVRLEMNSPELSWKYWHKAGFSPHIWNNFFCLTGRGFCVTKTSVHKGDWKEHIILWAGHEVGSGTWGWLLAAWTWIQTPVNKPPGVTSHTFPPFHREGSSVIGQSPFQARIPRLQFTVVS